MADWKTPDDGPSAGVARGKRDQQVYFIRCEANGLIKIGQGGCAVQRLSSLRTMSPVPIELVGIILCPDGRALERELHARFQEHRSHGEWFRPAPELTDFIRDESRPPRPKRRPSLAERAAKNEARRARRHAAEKAAQEAELDRELRDWKIAKGYADAA
jgi:hypothetical protein